MTSKNKRKRDSSATRRSDPDISNSNGDFGPSSSKKRKNGHNENQGDGGIEVIYRLSDGSEEWSKKLSRKKTWPEVISKVSKHLSFPWSPDVRLAHLRDGREVVIYDEFDYQAFRDQAFAMASKDPLVVKVYPAAGPSRQPPHSNLFSQLQPSTPRTAFTGTPGSSVAQNASPLTSARKRRKKKQSLLGRSEEVFQSTKVNTAGITEGSPESRDSAPAPSTTNTATEKKATPKRRHRRKATGTPMQVTGTSDGLKGVPASASESTEPSGPTVVTEIIEPVTSTKPAKQKRKRKTGEVETASKSEMLPVIDPVTQTRGSSAPVSETADGPSAQQVGVQPPSALPPPKAVAAASTSKKQPPSALKKGSGSKTAKVAKRVSLALPKNDGPASPSPLSSSKPSTDADAPLTASQTSLRNIASAAVDRIFQSITGALSTKPAPISEVSQPEKAKQPSRRSTKKAKALPVLEELVDPVQTVTSKETNPAALSADPSPKPAALEDLPAVAGKKAPRSRSKKAKEPSSKVLALPESAPQTVDQVAEAGPSRIRRYSPSGPAEEDDPAPIAATGPEEQAEVTSTPPPEPKKAKRKSRARVPAVSEKPDDMTVASANGEESTSIAAQADSSAKASVNPIGKAAATSGDRANGPDLMTNGDGLPASNELDSNSSVVGATKPQKVTQKKSGGGVKPKHDGEGELSDGAPMVKGVTTKAKVSTAVTKEIAAVKGPDNGPTISKPPHKRPPSPSPSMDSDIMEAPYIIRKRKNRVVIDFIDYEEPSLGARPLKRSARSSSDFTLAVSYDDPTTKPIATKKPKRKSDAVVSSPEVTHKELDFKSARPKDDESNVEEPSASEADSVEESIVVDSQQSDGLQRSAEEIITDSASEDQKRNDDEESIINSHIIVDETPAAPSSPSTEPTLHSPANGFAALAGSTSSQSSSTLGYGQGFNILYKPKPKSRFCVICFRTPPHLQHACPSVRRGLEVLEATWAKREVLANEKDAESKLLAKNSIDALNTWINKHKRAEIRRKIVGNSSGEGIILSESLDPALFTPPRAAVDSPETPKVDNATQTSASPTVNLPERADETSGHQPHSSAQVQPLEQDDQSGTIAESVEYRSSSPDSSDQRDEVEEVVASLSVVNTPESAHSTKPALSAANVNALPGPLSRLASQNGRNSLSAMSESSVAIESGSESGSDVDDNAIDTNADDNDNESDATSEKTGQEDDESDGSDDDSSTSTHSEASSAGSSGSTVSEGDPEDLVKHFLTAPLSQRDKAAARKSAAGMTGRISLSAQNDSDGSSSDKDDESENEDIRIGQSTAKGLPSRESSIGDLMDGAGMDGAQGLSDEEVGPSREDESESEMLVRPPSVSQPNAEVVISPLLSPPVNPLVNGDGVEADTPEQDDTGTIKANPSSQQASSQESEMPNGSYLSPSKFSDRIRAAGSVAFSELDGAIALREARDEEDEPLRAAGFLPAKPESAEAAADGSVPINEMSATQDNGLAKDIVKQLEEAPEGSQRDMPTSPSQLNGSQKSHLQPSADIATAPSAVNSTLRRGRSAPNTSHVSESPLDLTTNREKDTDGTQDGLVEHKGHEKHVFTSQFTQPISSGEVESGSVIPPSPKKLGRPKKANSQVKAADLPVVIEEEFDHQGTEDSASSAPTLRRSSRQPSSVPPSPSMARTSIRHLSASESDTPPANRRSTRTRSSATPSLPPSPGMSHKQTPINIPNTPKQRETPLFMSQSQPLATQAYNALPVTPNSKLRFRPNRPTPRQKNPPIASSPIAEESLTNEPSRIAGRKEETRASSEDDDATPRANAKSQPLPVPQRRSMNGNARQISTRSQPVSGFRPLSSLDKDTLRNGTSRAGAVYPSLSNLLTPPKPTRDARSQTGETESEASESENENDQETDPALAARFAGSKKRTTRSAAGNSQGRVVGW